MKYLGKIETIFDSSGDREKSIISYHFFYAHIRSRLGCAGG
jgi:hypothetical protein